MRVLLRPTHDAAPESPEIPLVTNHVRFQVLAVLRWFPPMTVAFHWADIGGHGMSALTHAYIEFDITIRLLPQQRVSLDLISHGKNFLPRVSLFTITPRAKSTPIVHGGLAAARVRLLMICMKISRA